MRLTEIFSFLKNNPSNEESTRFSRLNISEVKKEIDKNKQLKKFVRDCRKKSKINYEEDIFAEN